MADAFDPAKKATNATLSNGNLTITTAPSAYSAALTLTPRTAGKLYAELTINSVGSNTASSFGIGRSTANLSSIAGTDANSTGYTIFGGGSIYFNNVQNVMALGSASTRMDIAVDFGLPDVWIRGATGTWNGNGTANPATGVNGLRALVYPTLNTLFGANLYLMAAMFANSQATLNVGATGFVDVVPAGFTAWDAVAVTSQTLAMVLA